jgi:hypothetical protein
MCAVFGSIVLLAFVVASVDGGGDSGGFDEKPAHPKLLVVLTHMYYSFPFVAGLSGLRLMYF